MSHTRTPYKNIFSPMLATWIFFASLKLKWLCQWRLSHCRGSVWRISLLSSLLLQFVVLFFMLFNVFVQISCVATVANGLLTYITIRCVFIKGCKILPHNTPFFVRHDTTSHSLALQLKDSACLDMALLSHVMVGQRNTAKQGGVNNVRVKGAA